MINLPNLISLSRIFLLIPIILLFENKFYELSLIIFVIAAFTDFLDGYVARFKGQESETGALIDLLSDKIFVSVILIWLSFLYSNYIILVSTILIISREIIISYVRLHLNSLGNLNIKDLSADYLGKIKTTLQMSGIAFLIVSELFNQVIFYLSVTLILLSAIISWISLINYFKKWNL